VGASALALLLALAPEASAQADAALTHYLAAQTALAAGDRDAAATALAALASASTSTTIASRARGASRDASIEAVRLAFRDISMDATQWPLPDGVAIFYCADTMEGRGAFWLQKAGATANPYDPASQCGAETSVGRLDQEATVVGYFDSYAKPNSYSATRLDAPLLDVPLSVTGITRDLMDDQNTIDVNDAVRATSTTTPITGFGSRPNFYIVRGFYVFNYRDGVRIQLDGSAPVNSAALETVEVLRGPSSILYGKGEPGGLVNFTSKRPVPVFGGSAGVNFGSNGLVRGDLDVTTPLGAKGAGRLIVSGYGADSHRDSVESDAFYFNPSLSFRPGSRTSIQFAAEYIRYNYVPDFGVLVSPGGAINPFFTRETYMGDPAAAKAEMHSLRLNGDVEVKMNADWDMRFVVGTEGQDTDQNVFFQNLVDGGTTGYAGLVPPSTLLRVKFDEAPTRRYGYGRFENVFRFAHGGGTRIAHQLLAEVDYRRDNEDLDTKVRDYDTLSYVNGTTSTLLGGILPLGLGLVYDFKTLTDATQTDMGFAVQDLIAIGDRVNILAGARIEHNTIHTVRTGTEQTLGIAGGPVVSLDSAPPDSKNTSVAPRLGVVYKATPRLSLYSSYLTAFISPVPGLLTQSGDLLDPEHSRQLEGGVKAALRQDRLFLTAAAYKTVKDDAFVFSPGYAENAGREESQGFELELMGAVTTELNVMAGYTFTDMEFTESSPNLQGKTRPGMPQHAFSSWAQYAANQGQVRGLSIGAGVTATGEVFASYPNNATLDGYASLNAMVGYERGLWRVQLNAWNLNDALGYSPSGGFFTGADPNVNPMSALPIAGRRITTSLSFRFR
jgi:iron complex outermembrane receptor protein